MPLIDMPLDELHAYQGRNPRPADFDKYWDEAIKEMRAVDPQVELVPAAFTAPNAECFDLYYTGVGGARIHAKLARPKEADNCPAVVQYHGYGASSGDWNDKLVYASNGFVIAAMDCRGQGGLSQDTMGALGNTKEGMIIRGLDDPDPRKLYFRAVFLDAVQLIGIVMDMACVDATRVGTVGGSQGGALALAAAALEPRVNRVAAAYPFLCDYQRVWEMDLAEAAYAELRYYFRHFDPQHKREAEIFTKLGYIDVQHLMPRMKGRTLMHCGLMDRICPPSSQFAAYNKITSPKELVIYPDYGHERVPELDDATFQYMLQM